MNTALIIIAMLLLLVGLAGAVIPGLPGPPLSWVALLLLSLRATSEIGWVVLLIFALVCLVITLIDYLLPGRLTHRYGGSRAGVWGCNIGLVLSLIGLPFGPQGIIGLLFWPFVGALVGELIAGHDLGRSAKAAFGSFIGFLSGTLLKVCYCIAALIFALIDIF